MKLAITEETYISSTYEYLTIGSLGGFTKKQGLLHY